MSTAAARPFTYKPSPLSSQEVMADDYVILAPEGKPLLKVTAQVYEALAMFIGGQRRHDYGSLEIQFRSGGVAGVEVSVKLK